MSAMFWSWALGARLATALLLGGMVFFAFFMAPLVFTRLPAETAARLIRAAFPRYYDAMAGLAGLAAFACAFFAPGLAAVLLAVAAGFLLARLALMPAINAARDAGLQGDAAMQRRFARLHRASVALNLVQLGAVLAIAVGLYA